MLFDPLGGVHKLRLQSLAFFDHLPLRLHFLWYKSLQKVGFFDHLPPPIVNVVSERPLSKRKIVF